MTREPALLQVLDLEYAPDPSPSLSSYDVILINSSAGKDSLVMQSVVCKQAEELGILNRVVVVHCDLGRVEWQGTRELAVAQAAHFGVRFFAVFRRQGDLLTQIESRGKFPAPQQRYCTAHHKQNQVNRVFTQLTIEARSGDLLEQIEERGKFPDPRRRYCTSDQKRAPVHRLLTALADEARGHDRKRIRILNCMGMRADESPARAKKKPFTASKASNGRRQVEDWLPLHRWTLAEIWRHIDTTGLRPLVHYAYSLGMPRLSCCFCIFSTRSALLLAGKHNRALLDEYVAVERRIGHRFKNDLSLAEIAAALDAGEEPGPVSDWAM
jgi:3'-phosphoadenosine 5'-phosphosulfate sulfotransferase (PAPS reductase)/FAD synthetase